MNMNAHTAVKNLKSIQENRMSRIILIVVKDEETGMLVTSHGYNEDTFSTIITSQDHPKTLGAHFDRDIGEWVIPDRG